ncbi:hypothetical protein ABT034_33570 [Streptomyces sp. NPDC002773]|uniref:hypothetical protein n=1 Tax=Streptomyces sp. NPDC002773 TaxID=3154430 RepID=UPI0033234709
MVTRDQALAAARQILDATVADKEAADRNGGAVRTDTAHDAAVDLERLVRDTPDHR